jgi:UDP-N-acetylmuramyl tripeptide synthase
VAVGTMAACGEDRAIDPNSIVGVYTATTFRATPTGAAEIDVLAQGGGLVISIGGSNATTGALTLPATITGTTTTQTSMAGTAVRTGNGVRFDQTADTFVRDLNWTIATNALSVTNQTVGGVTYTILLTR